MDENSIPDLYKRTIPCIKCKNGTLKYKRSDYEWHDGAYWDCDNSACNASMSKEMVVRVILAQMRPFRGVK